MAESGDLGMYIFSRKILPRKLFFPDQLYLKNVKQASLSILVISLFDIVEQLKLRIAIFMSTQSLLVISDTWDFDVVES